MNILILTGSFGQGHQSVSRAIYDELDLEENKLEMLDIFQYLAPSLSKHIYSGFNLMVRDFKDLFNIFYRLTKNKTGDFYLAPAIKERLDQLLGGKNIDVVICTVPLAGKILSQYKKQLGGDFCLVNCITDTGFHGGWLGEQVDYYLVPSEKLRQELLKRRLPADRIGIIGIPVKKEFRQECRKKKPGGQVLIMGGGLGLIPNIDRIISQLLAQNYRITLITGKNKKLYLKYRAKYKEMEVLEYTDQVRDYMLEADLIISKPGGITLFESIHSETPILSIKPFLLQERDNSLYIEEKNIGRVIRDYDRLEEELFSILEDRETYYIMQNNMKAIKNSLNQLDLDHLINRILKVS